MLVFIRASLVFDVVVSLVKIEIEGFPLCWIERIESERFLPGVIRHIIVLVRNHVVRSEPNIAHQTVDIHQTVHILCIVVFVPVGFIEIGILIRKTVFSKDSADIRHYIDVIKRIVVGEVDFLGVNQTFPIPFIVSISVFIFSWQITSILHSKGEFGFVPGFGLLGDNVDNASHSSRIAQVARASLDELNMVNGRNRDSRHIQSAIDVRYWGSIDVNLGLINTAAHESRSRHCANRSGNKVGDSANFV